MRYNSELLEIKDLRSRNDVLYKDIKISLGLLITARKQHAEYRGNRNFGLSTTVYNRTSINQRLESAGEDDIWSFWVKKVYIVQGIVSE